MFQRKNFQWCFTWKVVYCLTHFAPHCFIELISLIRTQIIMTDGVKISLYYMFVIFNVRTCVCRVLDHLKCILLGELNKYKLQIR